MGVQESGHLFQHYDPQKTSVLSVEHPVLIEEIKESLSGFGKEDCEATPEGSVHSHKDEKIEESATKTKEEDKDPIKDRKVSEDECEISADQDADIASSGSENAEMSSRLVPPGKSIYSFIGHKQGSFVAANNNS